MKIEIVDELKKIQQSIDELKTIHQSIDEMKNIQQSVDGLKDEFEEKIKIDDWKNKKYDEMHSLMMKYQDGIVEKMIDPLLKSLITLCNSIRKDIELFKGKENSEDTIDYLHGLLDQVESILFDYDIEAYTGPEVFDPKLQKVSKTVATADEGKDKQIESVVSTGYMRNENVFVIEKVNIYKFKKEVMEDE